MLIIIIIIKIIIYERAYEMDSHKHANTSIYMSVLIYERDSHKHANTSIYERAYERDSHKDANTSIYISVLMRGILISTLTQAYMSRVLMRHQIWDSHKHANTSIYERAY